MEATEMDSVRWNNKILKWEKIRNGTIKEIMLKELTV